VSSVGVHAYTAHAATANVSRYGPSAGGALSLEAGIAGTTAPGAVDLNLSDGDGSLYVLSSGSSGLTGFSMNAGNGALTGIGGVSGLATG